MQFQRATRRKVWIKLGLVGASGSGKTFSALRLATGLGGKIAVLDTENGSADLYADRFEYDTCTIQAPFTVERYREVINLAVRGGYNVLVMDSLSHAWAGAGGLLEQKDALDRRGGNQFANWQPITQQQEQFKAAILEAPIHIIGTMRAKADYVIDEAGGKKTPRKVGLAAIQRDGMEYELSVVFMLSADTIAVTDKDRTNLFRGHNAQLTEEHGQSIARWLDSGAEPLPAPAPSPAATVPPQRVTVTATASSVPGASATPNVCVDCGKSLTSGRVTFAMKNLGRAVCLDCERKPTEAAEVAEALREAAGVK